MKKVRTVNTQRPQKTVNSIEELKFGFELKEINNRNIQFEPAFVISMTGEKAAIRSGLIKAMLADETFAKHITLAAEYFKTIEK